MQAEYVGMGADGNVLGFKNLKKKMQFTQLEVTSLSKGKETDLVITYFRFWQTYPVKGQTVNILGFVGRAVSIELSLSVMA